MCAADLRFVEPMTGIEAAYSQAADALVQRLLGFALDGQVPDPVALAAIRDALDRAGLGAKTEVALELKPYEHILNDMAGVAQITRAESRARRGLPDDPALAEPMEVVDAELVDDGPVYPPGATAKGPEGDESPRLTRPRPRNGYGPGRPRATDPGRRSRRRGRSEPPRQGSAGNASALSEINAQAMDISGLASWRRVGTAQPNLRDRRRAWSRPCVRDADERKLMTETTATKARTTRLGAYVRVSTIEQAEKGYGLDVQREAIRKAARQLGAKVVTWTADEGKNGTLDAVDRPGLLDALTRL
jgi:hypothetical protein